MKSAVTRWIYIPDQHYPYHDKPAINCVLKAIKIIKPDGFCNLGDFTEGEAVSHWQWKRRKRPPIEYQLKDIDAEIKKCNAGLDQIDEVLDKAGVKQKVFIQGNHDAWYDLLVEEHPYLKDYTFDRAYRIKERGYKYYPIGEQFKNGKLYAYHGHLYAGVHHTKNHLLKMGVNVIYGHHHDIQQHSVTHIDGEKSAWSIGCLKSFRRDDANDWLGGRPTNWAHGFAVVDFFNGGLFTVHVIWIIKGKCSLFGELIDGNKGA